MVGKHAGVLQLLRVFTFRRRSRDRMARYLGLRHLEHAHGVEEPSLEGPRAAVPWPEQALVHRAKG